MSYISHFVSYLVFYYLRPQENNQYDSDLMSCFGMISFDLSSVPHSRSLIMMLCKSTTRRQESWV